MRKLVVLVVVLVLALATPALASEAEGQWEYWNDVIGWQWVLPGEYQQLDNGTWIWCGQHYGYNPEAKVDVWQWSCKPA